MSRAVRRRFLSVLLACGMTAGLLAGCGGDNDPGNNVNSDSNANSSSNENNNIDELTAVNVAIQPVSSAVIPSTEGVTEVEDAINAIAAQDGIKVKLNFYSSDSYAQQMSLMMAGGEDLDAMLIHPGFSFANLVAQNQLADITDLLDEYAPDLKALIRDEFWNAVSIDGRIRMVPTWDDKVTGLWFCMRKDILEKYDLLEQADAIKSLDDIEALYEAIAPNEPNIAMVTSGANSNILTSSGVHFGDTFDNNQNYDTLGDPTYRMGIVWDGEKEVANYFTSDQFKQEIDKVHEWYENGWVYQDAATVTEDSYIYVKAGSVFSYFTNAEMNCEADASVKCATDMVCKMVGSIPISGDRVRQFGWGVPSTSKNPEAAVKFLNLLYTNEDVANLLNYGIEGKHYEDKGDGTIGFPDGVDTNNTTYYFNAAFAAGNYYLLKVWEGNSPTLREDALKVNQEAPLSEYMGFSFDNTGVKNEVTATTAAYEEFYQGLITGVSDPDTVLDQFLSKLEAAGIDKIIEEKQTQLNAYLSGN